jgi:hypothetical protein
MYIYVDDKRPKNGRPHGSGRSVIQIDELGREMPFDNAEMAAEAAEVSIAKMYRWLVDGKEHAGFWWRWEGEG